MLKSNAYPVVSKDEAGNKHYRKTHSLDDAFRVQSEGTSIASLLDDGDGDEDGQLQVVMVSLIADQSLTSVYSRAVIAASDGFAYTSIVQLLLLNQDCMLLVYEGFYTAVVLFLCWAGLFRCLSDFLFVLLVCLSVCLLIWLLVCLIVLVCLCPCVGALLFHCLCSCCLFACLLARLFV